MATEVEAAQNRIDHFKQQAALSAQQRATIRRHAREALVELSRIRDNIENLEGDPWDAIRSYNDLAPILEIIERHLKAISGTQN